MKLIVPALVAVVLGSSACAGRKAPILPTGVPGGGKDPCECARLAIARGALILYRDPRALADAAKAIAAVIPPKAIDSGTCGGGLRNQLSELPASLSEQFSFGEIGRRPASNPVFADPDPRKWNPDAVARAFVDARRIDVREAAAQRDHQADLEERGAVEIISDGSRCMNALETCEFLAEAMPMGLATAVELLAPASVDLRGLTGPHYRGGRRFAWITQEQVYGAPTHRPWEHVIGELDVYRDDWEAKRMPAPEAKSSGMDEDPRALYVEDRWLELDARAPKPDLKRIRARMEELEKTRGADQSEQPVRPPPRLIEGSAYATREAVVASASGEIAGFVREVSGEGIPDVTVVANGSMGTRATGTDADGHFAFADLPPGGYDVTALMKSTGAIPSTCRGLLVEPGKGISVEFTFARVQFERIDNGSATQRTGVHYRRRADAPAPVPQKDSLCR